MAQNLPPSEVLQLYRKAFKRVAKQLVEAAHETAAAECIREHQERRYFAAQALEVICTFCSANPNRLAGFRQLVLAALAYAREEALWFFLHINEVRP